MFWIHWPFRSAFWERWMEYCAASWSHIDQSWSNQAWQNQATLFFHPVCWGLACLGRWWLRATALANLCICGTGCCLASAAGSFCRWLFPGRLWPSPVVETIWPCQWPMYWDLHGPWFCGLQHLPTRRKAIPILLPWLQVMPWLGNLVWSAVQWFAILLEPGLG